MTLSTFTAGLLIAIVTITCELLDRDIEKEKQEFENSN